MTDAIKIAVKAGLIAVITAAVIAIFATVQIPTIDFTTFTNALSVGLAVVYHWIPVSRVIFPIFIFLLGFDMAIRAFNLAMIAVRWVMKVNE